MSHRNDDDVVASAQPLGSATVTVEQITPQIAAALLTHNTHNRPIRAAGVARYAEAIRHGQWLPEAGTPICVGEDDVLLDGQHRLAAIVQTETTIPMVVVRNVPAGVQDVIDTGKARTPGDALTLHGYADGPLCAAALRYVAAYRAHRTFTKAVDLTTIDTLVMMEAEAHLPEFARAARDLGREYAILSPAMTAAVGILAAEALGGPDVPRRFYTDLAAANPHGATILDALAAHLYAWGQAPMHSRKRPARMAVAVSVVRCFNIWERDPAAPAPGGSAMWAWRSMRDAFPAITAKADDERKSIKKGDLQRKRRAAEGGKRGA